MRSGPRVQLIKRIEAASTLAPLQPDSPLIGDWLIAIFAAVVQQGAFLSIPLYFGGTLPTVRGEQNNTILVYDEPPSPMKSPESSRHSLQARLEVSL
jgi:hypothetical protein